jgi:hypothetical protein
MDLRNMEETLKMHTQWMAVVQILAARKYGMANGKYTGKLQPPSFWLCWLASLFAIGHHLLYNSLDGQSVQNVGYSRLGSVVSSQQMNIAGKTAFAFLVEAYLTITIGTAYTRFFWRAILYRTPEPTLQKLDATFSSLTNVYHLFRLANFFTSVCAAAGLITIAINLASYSPGFQPSYALPRARMQTYNGQRKMRMLEIYCRLISRRGRSG